MPAIARGQARPAKTEAGSNPFVCAMVTAASAATFWLGMVWVAQRIMS